MAITIRHRSRIPPVSPPLLLFSAVWRAMHAESSVDRRWLGDFRH
jgi:hypothetical protein